MSTRSRISLDGHWDFWVDSAASLTPTSLPVELSTPIAVPSPWQSQSPDLRLYSGAAWYRRSIEVPAAWLDSRQVILGIDASDYTTEVWVNDIKIGEHEGGYLPFEFDITSAVQAGENTVTIRVDDPPGLFAEVPHGKQGWYGPLSGIWQSVWVEARSALFIKNLNVYPDLPTGAVEVTMNLSSQPKGPGEIHARVLSADGEVVVASRHPLPFRSSSISFSLQVDQPLAWSPDHPHLYRLEVELLDTLQPIDQHAKTFGFRTIEARDGKLYLNGELFYMRGALDQDYYPDTIYTSPTEAYLEDQIIKAKQMGLNLLRCHIKVADPRYYEVADRLGMLVWTELPNWSTLTEHSGQRGRQTMQGIVDRDGHHPSIIAWTIINEDWGTDLVNEPWHRKWLKEMYHWLKGLDPTRLVIDNSPCEPNFHVQTDIEDFHFYRAIPDHRHEWDQFVRDFAGRASFTFCPSGEGVRTGKEPLIVSEFGNWGLPDIDGLRDAQGLDPWWFDTGAEWSEGVVYPQGVRGRFKTLGLARVFGSWKAFVQATQWQQYLAMKYQIESMRRQAEIAGYVITELTDVHWECNGLLDMNRNTKVYQDIFHAVNADTVIIPEWQRVAFWAGEQALFGATLSHGGGQPLEGGELRWRLEGHGGENLAAGTLAAAGLAPGEVRLAGSLRFQVPQVPVAAVYRLFFELFGASGQRLAWNHLDLALFPARQTPEIASRITLYTADSALASRLSSLGYQLADSPQNASLTIAPRLDEDLRLHMQDGGRVLLLADRLGANGAVMPGLRIEARGKTPYCGDWASSFSWVERTGAFSNLPGGPLIDHSFDAVIPDYVILGVRDWEFPALVQSGMVLGWVHKPAALITEKWHGRGKAVVTTYRITDESLGCDPTATALLDGLIDQALAR